MQNFFVIGPMQTDQNFAVTIKVLKACCLALL